MAHSPAVSGDQQDERILRNNQHGRYPRHQQPRAMSILVPIDESIGNNKKNSVKRPTPRASYAPESMQKKSTHLTTHDENRSVQQNKEKSHSVEGVHIYYPLEVLNNFKRNTLKQLPY